MSETLMQGNGDADSTTEDPQVNSQINPIDDRPEWLPEKYKTPEDLAKAYKELESKLGSGQDEMRKSIMQEIESEAFKDRPDSAGDYQLPDIIDDSSAVDNELLQWWSDHAFENGYGQEEFQKGIEMYAQAVMGSQPDLEAEIAKLGDTSGDRIDAASKFAMKNFSEDHIPTIERMFETADGVMLMERIMEMTKDGNFSGESAPASGITEAELQEMMRDPRYWQGDTNYVKKVQDGFAKLYG
jgi:hypothetical protein